jgi:predicted signal transduction protein with EAL and GGDEF domain
VRGSDLCGRPGGDEFCVLLMNCDLKRARHIAEQICAKVADYRLAWGQQFFSVGISIGVAPTSAVTDAESLLRLADAACYAAKNAGRNRIHVVDPPSDAAETAQVRRLHLPDAGAADPARSAAGGSRYRRRDGSGGR